MTREEYRKIRKASGMSQQALSNWLGVAMGTVYRREAGTSDINDEAAHAMELLDHKTKRFIASSKRETITRR